MDEHEIHNAFRTSLLKALDVKEYRTIDDFMEDAGPFPDNIRAELALFEFMGWAEEEGLGRGFKNRWRAGDLRAVVIAYLENLELRQEIEKLTGKLDRIECIAAES
ncbi:hypothetical protein [Novosphingobium sp.]|uniref:hypothetical protein n=1 Tax=Novosphingobium sp. TaxID=1874826 RepID=UPI00286ACF4C|nr:hypothetical protein [Novosphingobium sp.]